MYQYKRLFGLARVPTEHGCKQRLFSDSRHIVVMRKGQLYWFEVLDQEHRSLLTESELVATLRAIVRDADGAGGEHAGQEPIGVLSTEKRRTWYELRTKLEEEPHNRRNLSMIDSALFVLCLDDDAPADVTDLTNNMLCGTYRLHDGRQVGTCLNRWYDKLQIIVCKNGAAGVNFEHSSADGHTVLRFVGDIYTELILQFARSINPNTKSLFQAKISPFARSEARKHKRASSDMLSDVQARTTPRRLEWTLTPRLVRSIQHAEMRLSDLICQNECFVLEFKGYGKRFITNHGFSPDAFVQMAFQATYYTLYGRAAPTYEPAMTKAFLRGRTETIRTVQPHTMAHLYSLLALWRKQHGARGEKVPEFFKDSGYKTLNHVVLSTSNCGNPSLRIFGFGPVVQDGFGIGYIIQDHKLTICVSSKHLQTQRFLKALEQYLAFKAANIHATQTYIDLAGNECDIRTGLPIGSLRIAKDQDIPSKNQCYGTSGYSFYGDDDGHDSEEYIEYNPREGVGKMVFVREYD
ncbi:YAT1 [Malassezia furfur]|nr:YAT1 [Malassezia furfur]